MASPNETESSIVGWVKIHTVVSTEYTADPSETIQTVQTTYPSVLGIQCLNTRKQDHAMIAIRQIHEQLASMIEVPVEIRNRRTEVIFLVVDGSTESPNENSDGMDLTADEFFGALPDFAERAPQGEFETRLELP